MFGYLFWIYFINLILLINHEIDSAYWKEWKLFKLPYGISGFLIFNLIIITFFLYGMIQVYETNPSGLFFSLFLSLSGIFAFIAHMYFIKKGNKEFTIPISLFILGAIFIVSLVQLWITIILSGVL
jgi:hypothetical protein